MDETFPDLGSMSDTELKDVIRQLAEEEMEISYKRRILHGKIDILRAELVSRLRNQHERGASAISGDDVQALSDILARRTEHAGHEAGGEGLGDIGGGDSSGGDSGGGGDSAA